MESHMRKNLDILKPNALREEKWVGGGQGGEGG